MEVDGDVGKLAEELCSLGTVDHEVLIRQFQQILGQDLSVESCTFFLDMNNWNLPAALGSYYDLGGSTYNGEGPPPELVRTELPQMSFERDITIGEGESVPPNTRFIKTWRVRNCGSEPWPIGVVLKHIEGELLSNQNSVSVPALAVGEVGDVSVEMISPSHRGIYQSRWQMITADGIPFGEAIWCIIVVDDMGLLGLTQQLASTGCDGPSSMNPQGRKEPAQNPFSAGLSFPLGWTPTFDRDSHVDISSLSADPRCPALSPLNENRLPSTPPSTSALLERLSSDRSERMTMSDNVEFAKRHGPPHSSSSTPSSVHSLDASIMATRGSPAPHHISIYDVDPPASPNGSSALYEAVAAALPPWQHINSTAPVNIPTRIQGGITPDVPPCTPCTPPTMNSCQESSSAQDNGDNQDMQI